MQIFASMNNGNQEIENENIYFGINIDFCFFFLFVGNYSNEL